MNLIFSLGLICGGAVILLLLILKKTYAFRRWLLSKEENELLVFLANQPFYVADSSKFALSFMASEHRKIIKDILAVLRLFGAEIKEEDDESAWKLALLYSPFRGCNFLRLSDFDGREVKSIENPSDAFQFMQIISEAIGEREKEITAQARPDVIVSIFPRRG
ncbi:MAG: hypothetical protein UV36_C0008G0010 [Parcubacteria group bacterium GW2011_GWC2_42_6]|nr:MAG: hypothetical protein UV36_C0008G0010 [Parcubacteria group bacterium GW2011_GWC2_42_6]KKT76733.1 MAG: hypothetical protein UW72_C0002G0035 [Parcubacteria group bacterium GW2011_GWF2_44_7]